MPTSAHDSDLWKSPHKLAAFGVLMALAVSALWQGAWAAVRDNVRQRVATSSFVPVEAVVINSEAISIETMPDLDRAALHGTVPHVTYRFVVGTTSCTAERFQYFPPATEPDRNVKAVQAILERYRAGSSVTAYRDPAGTCRAILNPGMPGLPILPVLFLVLYSGIPVIFLGKAIQAWKRSRSPPSMT